MTVEEVGILTLAEFREYLKFCTDKKKEDTNLMRHAVFNAIANAFKGSDKKPIELFEEDRKVKTLEELKEEREWIFGKGEDK